MRIAAGGTGRKSGHYNARLYTGMTTYEAAQARTAEAFDLFDHITVFFSGGKDSTACLNLALEEARKRGRTPLDVVFIDEEAIPVQTAEYVARVASLPDVAIRWYCLPVQHRNACSRTEPYWWPWDPDIPEKWCRPLPEQAITTLAGFRVQPRENRPAVPEITGLLCTPDLGRVGVIMGIRADESIIRYRAVTAKKEENWMVAYPPSTDRWIEKRYPTYHLTKVYPIYDWSIEDTWTAPKQLGWDYNRAYDVLEMAGIGKRAQRCSPAFGEEPLQKLWTFAHCFPEVWGPMTNRVPGAATAARYALTELYAYRKLPEKPLDEKWEDYLISYLDKFDPATRMLVRRRLRNLIRYHFDRTDDPIMEKNIHPDTGISWNYLTRIAMRGDLKNRRQPLCQVNESNYDRRKGNYERELAAYRERMNDDGAERDRESADQQLSVGAEGAVA